MLSGFGRMMAKEEFKSGKNGTISTGFIIKRVLCVFWGEGGHVKTGRCLRRVGKIKQMCSRSF